MALHECPECGNMVSDRAKKCPKCGFPLERETPVPETDPYDRGGSDIVSKNPDQPVKKKKVRTIVIVTGSLLLVAIAIVLVIVFSSSKEAGQEESSRTEAVSRVIGRIEAMGEVTLKSKDRIEEIVKEYTNLSEDEKKQVTNYSKLKNARAKLSMLESEEEAKKEAKQSEEGKKKEKEDTFLEIADKLNEVHRLTNSFVDGMKYYKDAESLYDFVNTHIHENKAASDLLGEAAILCNKLPGTSTLRTHISKAKVNLPLSLMSVDYASEQEYLEKLRDFCINMADAFTELGKLTDTYQ